MNSGMIMRKLPDNSIPDDALQLALTQYPSCVGVAVAEKDKTLNVARLQGKATLEQLKKIQEESKDCGLIFFFGKFAEGTPEDDIQPFTIIGDGDDDKVVMFADGEFVAYDQPNSHSSEYNATERFLGPTIAKIYSHVGGDLGKFNAELKDSLVEQTLVNTAANRVNITVITADGCVTTHRKGELHKVLPWGWMSQHMGYGQVPTAQGTTATVKETVVAKAKKKLFGAASAEPAPAEKPAVETPPKETPKETPVEAAPDKVVEKPTVTPDDQKKIEAEDPHAWDSPPAAIIEDKNPRKRASRMKDWYRTMSFVGKCPPDWEDAPRVRLKRTKDEHAKMLAKKEQVIASTEPIAQTGKKVHKTFGTLDPSRSAGTEALPVLSTEDNSKLQAWLKSSAPTKNAQKYGGKFDPVALAKKENELPNFEQNAGLTLETTFTWDYGMLKELGHEAGIASLALLAHRYRQLYMEELATQPLSSQVGKSTPETPATPQADKPVVAASDPAPVVKKKKVFGQAA